jgi:hypothetical protein
VNDIHSDVKRSPLAGPTGPGRNLRLGGRDGQEALDVGDRPRSRGVGVRVELSALPDIRPAEGLGVRAVVCSMAKSEQAWATSRSGSPYDVSAQSTSPVTVSPCHRVVAEVGLIVSASLATAWTADSLIRAHRRRSDFRRQLEQSLSQRSRTGRSREVDKLSRQLRPGSTCRPSSQNQCRR